MKKLWAVLLLPILLLCGCGVKAPQPTQPVETIDPYAGMVQVDSGFGTKIWVKEYEELDVNPFLGCKDWNGTKARLGVDVSEHQGAIDWAALLEENPEIDFAIVRAGYRGYGESGKLCRDAFFERNVNDAREQGLDVGLYFFSQATTLAEAEEEADFLLDMISAYEPEAFTLPIYFDWEHIEFDDARTDGVSGASLTDFAIAFCDRIAEAGHTPGIYAYRSLAYFGYDLPRIADYTWWIGALGETPDFYYAHDLWQFEVRGGMAGVEGEIDLDLWFEPDVPRIKTPSRTEAAQADSTEEETLQNDTYV